MLKAKIYYHDIGDYLSREEKLKKIKDFGSIQNSEIYWHVLEPNEHGDWLNVRSEVFNSFLSLVPEKKFDNKSKSFFIAQSNGIASGKDAFVYNSSFKKVADNIQMMIDFYNEQRFGFNEAKKDNINLKIENYIQFDSQKINWSDTFINGVGKNIPYVFNKAKIREGLYRPFFKQYFDFDKTVIHRTYQIPRLFPSPSQDNLVIITSGIGASKGFSALISDNIPNYHTLDTDQCFPLYWYSEKTEKDLFSEGTDDYTRHDGVSDYILKLCREQYGHKSNISKEDIFYYVYGILHSPDYRTAFEADLKKILPRLPLVESLEDFWAFSKAGRALAELHLHYEKIEPCKEAIVTYNSGDNVNYKVEKMRFGKVDKKEDKTTIIYNHQITISNIPLEAYEYVVNGKSAIDWIMERYAITTHKESGIQNNPNDWATEHNNEKYILNLLLSIITVSIETMKIVKSLPIIKFE